MATKQELQSFLTEAGVIFDSKALKAELETMVESVKTRQEMDQLMGALPPDADDASDKDEAKVPEETPALKPKAKPKATKTLVKVVGDQGISWRHGTLHNHAAGVRVKFNGRGEAWVDEDTAAFLRSENTVTVTDETQVVEA